MRLTLADVPDYVIDKEVWLESQRAEARMAALKADADERERLHREGGQAWIDYLKGKK
jgi:hypothetical protein